MGRTTTPRPPAGEPYVADSHDLIRVQGARVHDLKDVSVEIPKRRSTVFTGGSGMPSTCATSAAASCYPTLPRQTRIGSGGS